jgi:hypothetical protein
MRHIAYTDAPFQCEWGICNKQHNRRDHLVSHVTAHLPHRPFKCLQCDKAFKRKSDLKYHDKIHNRAHPKVQKHEERLRIPIKSLKTNKARTFLDMATSHPKAGYMLDAVFTPYFDLMGSNDYVTPGLFTLPVNHATAVTASTLDTFSVCPPSLHGMAPMAATSEPGTNRSQNTSILHWDPVSSQMYW